MIYRFLVFLLLLSCVGWAQQQQVAPSLESTVAAELADTGVKNALMVGTDTAPGPFASAIAGTHIRGSLATLRMGAMRSANDVNTQTYQTILLLMEHNQATQIGSPPDTKGTTSLAMKGAVPKILGFAVQHGAITQQVNGNTVTFRATPAGVMKALAGPSVQNWSTTGMPRNAVISGTSSSLLEKSPTS